MELSMGFFICGIYKKIQFYIFIVISFKNMIYTGTTGLYDAAKEMFFNTNEQTKIIGKELSDKVKDVYLGKGNLDNGSERKIIFQEDKLYLAYKEKNKHKEPEKSKIDSKFLIPDKFEPKKNNRGLLTFPKKYNIPNWSVSKFSIPTIPFNENDFIIVTLNDLIGVQSTTKSVLELYNSYNMLNSKGFKLKIENLDPYGVVVDQFILKGCKIINIEWSPIDYKVDSISTITLRITYNQVKIK